MEEKVEEVMRVGSRARTSQPREIRARNHPRQIGRSKRAGRSTVKTRGRAKMVMINRNSQMERVHAWQEVLQEVEVKVVDSS